MINETSSVDSTLESPTKPHKEKMSSQNKAIFLVHYINDNQTFNQKNEKLDKNGHGEKSPEQKISKIFKKSTKKKKICKQNKTQNNMLDFDAMLETLFPKEKNENALMSRKNNLERKKYQKKLIGNKRKRQIKDAINKSKFLLFNFNFIYIEINIKKGIKTHKSKDQGIINNKNNKSNYDIYNINNFYSNTVKIKEKSLSINVQVPKYEELDDSFFEDNNIEVRIIVNKIIFLLIVG